MQVLKRFQYLIGNQTSLSLTDLSLLNMLKQLPAFYTLHHYEHVLVCLERVPHLDDVRVANGPNDLNLVPEELPFLATE